MHHGTDADVLITFNKAKRESAFCEKSLKEISKRLNDVVLVFSPDKDLQVFLASLKELGKFSLTHQAVQIPPPYTVRADTILIPDAHVETSADDTDEFDTPRKNRKNANQADPDMKLFLPSPPVSPVHANPRHDIPQGKLGGCFKIRTAQDRDNCCITGLTCLSDGRIVLTDQMHRKVKLYDREFRWICERVISARPFDVAAISSTEIAVTLPREKRFLLMQVRN